MHSGDLMSLYRDFRKPIPTRIIVGSRAVIDALRVPFSSAMDFTFPGIDTFTAIPIHIDPTIGYSNLQVRDQYGIVLLSMTLNGLGNHES